MKIKRYDLYIHDIRHPLSENGKLLCELQRLVAILSFLIFPEQAKKWQHSTKPPFFLGLLLLVDGKLSSELLIVISHAWM